MGSHKAPHVIFSLRYSKPHAPLQAFRNASTSLYKGIEGAAPDRVTAMAAAADASASATGIGFGKGYNP